jgi:predicted alpha/beta superfamily hydrolase
VTGWLSYDEAHGPDHTVTGRVLVWPRVEGARGIPAREILVYLPPSIAGRQPGPPAPGERRYPTLYFQDGQNVFDERTSYAGEWRADETLEQLAGEGIEAIAVAVPNSGEGRMDEYNPWPSREPWWRRGRLVGGKGDAYLEWLVGTVKALVDASFPTSTERTATGIIGSSMGGLISLYGLIARGETFGLSGVLSPSLRWSDSRVLRVLEDHDLAPARVHLDAGSREWRGLYDDTRRLRDLLTAKGARVHYVEERNAWHREAAWARRLPGALRFLLDG